MKRILAGAFISIGYFINAQTVGNSPYAAFGLGEVKYDNTVEIFSMGGISTAYVSDFNSSFNFKNPAANKNVELTSIKLEATNENNFFRSNFNNIKSTKNSSYLSNISIAFPISKTVKFGLGYQPYSSKRYNLLLREQISDDVEKLTSFRGEGTVSTVHAAVSYQVTPEFGLGLRTNFYSGNVYDINELAYSNAELVYGNENKNKVRSFNFTLGGTYQKELLRERKLTFGATATFGNTNNIKTTNTLSTYYYTSANTKAYQSIISENTTESKNLLPMEFSIGAGYGQTARWFVGTQLEYKKGEKIQFFNQSFVNQDSYRISAGGWVLPNANNFRNYFQRIVYRYGAFYERGNLNLYDTNINAMGITMGALFPFKNSNINRMTGLELGIELGKKGTLKNNLINQNFINLKLGFNFSDKWFRKNYYD